jgi:hypothetical protein
MSTEATDMAPRTAETADRIILTLPGSPGLRGVVTLVLGGIGSRLDLPYEKVDDLQLAVLSVLSASDLETVTIDVVVDDGELRVSVGPLPAGIVSDRGLRRVLERLVDAVEQPGAETVDGAFGGVEADWLTLALTRPPADSADE